MQMMLIFDILLLPMADVLNVAEVLPVLTAYHEFYDLITAREFTVDSLVEVARAGKRLNDLWDQSPLLQFSLSGMTGVKPHMVFQHAIDSIIFYGSLHNCSEETWEGNLRSDKKFARGSGNVSNTTSVQGRLTEARVLDVITVHVPQQLRIVVAEGVHSFANLCVDVHRLHSLSDAEYVASMSDTFCGLDTLGQQLADVYGLDLNVLLASTNITIKTFSSLHLSCGGFVRCDSSFRGSPRYDTISLFSETGETPIYGNVTCARLVQLLSVNNLPIALFSGAPKPVLSFALVNVYCDKDSVNHRQLGRRYLRSVGSPVLIPISRIHSSVHLITNPIDPGFVYLQKSRLYTTAGDRTTI